MRKTYAFLLSLPTRERGLKSVLLRVPSGALFVAPHAGAWIEISLFCRDGDHVLSLPTRERGLK